MPKKRTIQKFALVEKEILYSRSWASLSNSAKVVYVYLKGEFNGYNGDKLKLPYSQMKDVMSNATFWRGVKSLEEAGFIDIVSHGGLEKRPNVYKISGRWRLREKTLAEYQDESRKKEERRSYRQSVEHLLSDTNTQNET